MPFTGIVEPEQLAILTSVVEQHCLRAGIDLASPESKAVAHLVIVLFKNGAATIDELKAALLIPSEREEAERYG